jgi:L-ascorbate metabolism protein UlaG (beta-lactamase superfamily)
MWIDKRLSKITAMIYRGRAASGAAVKLMAALVLVLFALILPLALLSADSDPQTSPGKILRTSDHFDGHLYFNPGLTAQTPQAGNQPRRSSYGWIRRWIIGNDWPEWKAGKELPPGPRPAARVPEGTLNVIPVGHATFLIQMDGLNILTDPIWSERCSPVSWAGPRRHRAPGVRFDDLPSIDVVLISHNHYDHLDLPTLENLAEKGVPLSITALGNRSLIRGAGIPRVEELDWWQSFQLSPKVTVTLVPAQHFSARTLWDRNKTLWGGFVISGPSGNLYFAGDTGYGPHFQEIAHRFSPIRVAILPIAPFSPQQSTESSSAYRSVVHMGPAEAVRAHLDLDAQVSIAAHFQVFQLGPDGFDDAVNELASTLKAQNLTADTFIVPTFGWAVALPVLPGQKPYRLAR